MWSWVMQRRKQVVIATAVLLVVMIATPLIWWQWFGPQRFEDLQLGAAPQDVVALDDLGNVPGDALDEALLHRSFDDDGQALEPEPVIELPPLTISDTTVVTVIFSVGSDGMTRADADRLRVADVGDRGSDRLTDSVMLLISDPATREAALLSLPRDLWMRNRGHRINESFARFGTQAFVDDVSRVSGLPIHHLVQVNFTAFADLVDAVGGVAIEVPRPMADLYSALYVPEAGCWRFDGPSALAYARSRHTLTTTDGQRWRGDDTASDFGRIRRQQTMAAAAWDQVRGPSFVRRLPDLIRLADGLTIDSGLGLDDVVDLARAFSDVAAGRVAGYTLPTVDRRVGAAQVVVIDWSRALPLYERLRSWPPSSGTAAAGPSDGDGPTEEPTDPADEATTEPADSPTGPTDEASAEPSTDPEDGSSTAPTSQPTDEPGASGRVAHRRQAGCTRSTAWELPENPFPYLAAIDAREPVPPYTPEPADADGPSGEGSDGDSQTDEADVDNPSDDGTSDGTDGDAADEPGTEPSDEPSDEDFPDILPPPGATDEAGG